MERLNQAIAGLLELRPGCPALTNLALDCWKVGAQRGEGAGLEMAAIVRAGVERYTAHERFLKGFGAWKREG